MSRQRMSEHLGEYYGSLEPSAEVRTRLREMSELEHAQPGASKPRWRPTWLQAAAAALALALIPLVFFLVPSSVTSERLAREIATNHLKESSGAFQVASLGEINELLPRLAFDVVPVKRLNETAGTIHAGYCSLGGQLAVQVTFVDAEGDRTTLYQVGFDERFEDVAPGRFSTGDVEVELWQDSGSGVWLGLASDQTR